MQEKIKALENKLQYYESEHNTFQNQLLVQRKSHEQEMLMLKKSADNSEELELKD